MQQFCFMGNIDSKRYNNFKKNMHLSHVSNSLIIYVACITPATGPREWRAVLRMHELEGTWDWLGLGGAGLTAGNASCLNPTPCMFNLNSMDTRSCAYILKSNSRQFYTIKYGLTWDSYGTRRATRHTPCAAQLLSAHMDRAQALTPPSRAWWLRKGSNAERQFTKAAKSDFMCLQAAQLGGKSLDILINYKGSIINHNNFLHVHVPHPP